MVEYRWNSIDKRKEDKNEYTRATAIYIIMLLMRQGISVNYENKVFGVVGTRRKKKKKGFMVFDRFVNRLYGE